VVFTHLDLDHAGGLGDFPEATAHVRSAEHAAAMARRGSPMQRGRYRPAHYRGHAHWDLYGDAGGEDWLDISGAHRVRGLDGVWLVPLPGHSAGHAGVAVALGERWVLHAGDSFLDQRQLTAAGAAFRLPPVLAGFEVAVPADRHAYRASLETVRRVAANPHVDVFCAHDRFRLAAAVTPQQAQ